MDNAPACPRLAGVRLLLRRDPEAPAIAREAIRSWSSKLGLGHLRDDAIVLLVSEVVTNAVLHSTAPDGASIVLEADFNDDRAIVAVTDAGDGFMPTTRAPRLAGGFGLYLLDREASRWGVERSDRTCVWFEL